MKRHDDDVDDVQRLELRVIGWVRSPLRDPADAASQAYVNIATRLAERFA